jgi:hypothetical protein
MGTDCIELQFRKFVRPKNPKMPTSKGDPYKRKSSSSAMHILTLS